MKNITEVHELDKDCCSLEERINTNVSPKEQQHTDHDGHDHSHDHAGGWKAYLTAIISLILLLTGLALEHWFKADFFKGWVKIIWYIAAYLPVGLPVLKP